MVDKKGKKQWYEILATKNFGNVIIGETVAYEHKNLIGRVVDINLGNLTRDVKLQNIKLKFRIINVSDGKANTEIKGYELVSSYIKRIIKVGRSRVDDSFDVVTLDKVKIKIKPLILTKYKAQKNVLKNLRNLVKNEFVDYIQKENYEKFVSDLVSKKLQRDVRSKLNKIYPVSVVEIRLMDRI